MGGAIAMNGAETVRPDDFGLDANAIDVSALAAFGATQAAKTRIAALLVEARGRPTFEDTGLDETTAMIREHFFAFTAQRSASRRTRTAGICATSLSRSS